MNPLHTGTQPKTHLTSKKVKGHMDDVDLGHSVSAPDSRYDDEFPALPSANNEPDLPAIQESESDSDSSDTRANVQNFDLSAMARSILVSKRCLRMSKAQFVAQPSVKSFPNFRNTSLNCKSYN